jgi:hypothetical protein
MAGQGLAAPTAFQRMMLIEAYVEAYGLRLRQLVRISDGEPRDRGMADAVAAGDLGEGFTSVASGQRLSALVRCYEGGGEYQVVSIQELINLTDIDVFPALPASVKATAMELPKPRPRGRRRNAGSDEPPQTTATLPANDDLVQGILEAIGRRGRRR